MSEHKELLVKADSRLNFSVNTQLKEQLKWLIGLGNIAPGDMLPSANLMADQLGLNRNTVNLVYTQLRDEGLLSMHKGRGTQVMDNEQVGQLRKNREAMQQLAVKAMEEAAAQRIPLADFFVAGLAYVLLNETETAPRMRIVFIECREHDHPFYRQQIERITNAEVATVYIEDLNAMEKASIEAIGHANVIVTTLNHADEVKQRLASYKKTIHVIGATIEMPLLVEISKMKPGSKVSFVCLGKAGGQWMARNVHEAGLMQIESEAVGIDNRKELAKSIQQADKVYASAAVFEELRTMASDKVELYPMVLEKSSVNMLADLSHATSQDS
ncbi:GntR family transcriptional regulator [Paenibacillus kobensis]|uniref:GntR family transcriptional regulator n=1 Tax=Paenibacillus kobensis TaxID=59841 RepID=UPI0013E30D22|nr:GntR family transcriptional regulator [Paenibacillus kobensis]